MMGSLLGSVQQTLQMLFLIRYLVLQPLWGSLKATGLHPLLSILLSLLEIFGNREIPFD